MNFRDCLFRLTEWGLTLQEVVEDRTSMGLLDRGAQSNCMCSKAQVSLRDHLFMTTQLGGLTPCI